MMTEEKVNPQKNNGTCGRECEVFSRIVGYMRPVQSWNWGKQQEFKERKEFKEKVSLGHDLEKE